MRLWTKGSAWFTGEETVKGSIAAGHYGDFAILDRDYLSVPDEQIRDIQSNLTAVDGRIVHASGEFVSLAPALPKLEPDWSPVNEFGGFYQPA